MKPKLVAVRKGSEVFHIEAPGDEGHRTMCGIVLLGGLLPAAEAGRACPRCKREWLAMARAVEGALRNR